MQSNTVVMTSNQTPIPPVMQIQPTVRTTNRFQTRHIVYKLSMAWLALSIVLFIVGFSAPAWFGIQGLWMICLQDICISNISIPYQDWFNAVRAMECLALAALITCMIVEVYQDFCNRSTAKSFVVEMLAIIGSIFSFIGLIVYGVKTELYEPHMSHIPLGWGFRLTISASSMILISAVIVCFFRTKSASPNSAYTPSSQAHPGIIIQVPANSGYAGGYNGGYVYAANNQSVQPYLYPAAGYAGNQFSYPAMTAPPYEKNP